MRASGELKVLVRIAGRNLLAGRARTFIIGGIVLVGAMLVVAGSSFVDSVDGGMRSSIQGSLGGHLQAYSNRSKDDLALYGGMMGESRLEPIEDFSRVKEALLRVPGVRTVVPMGIDQALVAMGNQFDVQLERLRADVRRLEAGDRHPELRRSYEAKKSHVRRMVQLLRDELRAARSLADDQLLRDRAEDTKALIRAVSDEFWNGFDGDRLGSLEFLENKIAPQQMDSSFTFVRYVGTDIDAFLQAFDRTVIVEGTRVPSRQRGILLGKWYAEEYLKLKSARRLDKIKDARESQGRRIAKDEELQRWVKENHSALREVQLQLDPIRAEEAARKLKAALGSEKSALPDLLHQLLDVTDQNFDQRYRVFYEVLAPMLQLYSIRVGDTITIKAPSKSGYFNSVNVKVYGFVEFKGLEKSALAGVMSLLDIMTWRDLYGYMTREKAEEIKQIKAAAGVRSLDRQTAEAELFGGAAPLEGASRAGSIDQASVLRDLAAPAGVDLSTRLYGQEEIDRGVALNAAVLLENPRRLRAGLRAVREASEKASLGLKVVDWQTASGLVGQTVTLFRAVLYTAVTIIFAVALVIINNAMVMATLQRVKEIGTMRAIGAQRRFVLAMLLGETATVALLFGLLGAGLGGVVVWVVRALGGIPATNDTLYFLYAGPALMPALGAASVAVSLGIVLAVSILSGFYPALIAMRVTPVEAMGTDD
ncbi:MAG TPA: FtsX-like permease family protein [Anaeromyxobacteraceae bacterium]|nr:FtsX-like permease family protein [Anaeromyxobacteraceae bacterium]